ncbi:AAA family ATPase [Pelomonas cellulosilytica]|uniref:AAA family ATPase n=1 Tax=Pelomonas cellulosilytica TaxID=2906762 RepID=A0ABS8XT02_9BURK|nr:AAA family ATPase [Pelomonas sp. P8]MCE4553799.1 AAA family ATPase [Pelomonas sp. P8]
MQVDENLYLHQPISGLPESLLRREGRETAILALMRRHTGLNRDRRRDMQKSAYRPGPLADLARSDVEVPPRYTNAEEQFRSFWSVVPKLRSGLGPWMRSPAYATALAVPLLKDYAPDWLNLKLDEVALALACPEWQRIRDRLQSHAAFDTNADSLGIFMLWPRVVEDLDRWAELEAERRTKAGRAAYALSLIGWSRWFVDEALKRCAQLSPELGALVQSADAVGCHEQQGVALAAIAQCDEVEIRTWEATDAAMGESDWADLLARLDVVAAELRQNPTQQAVSDLAALAEEFGEFGASLPQRERPAAERFEALRRDLMIYLRALGARAGFDWLNEELIAQIDARWQLALAVQHEPDAIDELAADAQGAIARTEQAADLYERATAEVADRRIAVQAAEQAGQESKGFGAQAAARRRQTVAQQGLSDAISYQQSRYDQLIDGASPFSEPFDYSADYAARLNESNQSTESLDDRIPAAHEDGDEAVVFPHDPPQPSAPNQELPEVVPQLVEAEGSAEQAAAVFAQAEPHAEALTPPPDEQTATTPSAVEDTTSQRIAAYPYSEVAGDRCRPIWASMVAGQPALAYQAARWIELGYAGTKVPPPDLLAATALAEELMLPDGQVQAALGARFEQFVPEDYAADTPPSWHAAVNLLLAAATLRPMVLAPSTSAATVSAYLHQDGHYPALYALVQRLRELSSKLVGFRVDPTVLRQARGEAAIRADLQALQHTADDWLRVQAQAYTIKFSAATAVWKRWIRPGGEIEALVAPVVHNRIADAQRVRERLAVLSDSDQVARLIHITDRKLNERRRGEDIHAGALEHLLRLVDEALKLPRQWLAQVELLGRHGDQLRDRLEAVHAALRDKQSAVEQELLRTPEHDPWGLVAGGQQQALRAVRGLLDLFDSASPLADSEPTPSEILGRPLLCLADLPISEDWKVDVQAADGLAMIDLQTREPVPAEQILQIRLARGDLLGVEMMVEAELVRPDSVQLRAERERWKQTVRGNIADCRRSVEVGLAYGYLPEADRSQFESQLARWEAQLDDMRRFDFVMAQIREIRDRVTDARAAQAQDVRSALHSIAHTESMRASVGEVEQALNEGDIATARELVHWIQQGKPAPTDLDEEVLEGFDHFFPGSMQAIEAWLDDHRRDTVEQAIKQGQAIPGMDAERVDSAQRAQAAKMYSSWSDMKTRQIGDRDRLELLLTGIGFTVRNLQQAERVSGREVWTLDAAPIEDRHVCPLPMYGSSAGGRYRVICVWGRPTEDELLQWVGDLAVNRPALLLYFGRMSERKWRDLGRMTKTKRRSLMLLDETLLVYLFTATGSRLRAWFDVAMPFSYSLPYDASAGLVPAEMFYGRGLELEAVRGLNGRCFIYGGRQLGKTALLKRAEQSFHSPTRGHYARWIDLRAEGIGVSLAAGEIWVTLHDKLKELQVLDAKSSAPIPGKKHAADLVVRAIRDFLSANADRRVLLLLDEADRFFEQDGRNDFEETRKLKQLMDDTQRRFKVVFAGLHNVLRMTERPNHPLAHFGEPIEIGPLHAEDEVKEAADLIRKPMAAAGFVFESKSLVIRILAQTNYYPSLIQLYCSQLLRNMLNQVAGRQRLQGPRYAVTDSDIEQVYSSDALRDEIRAKFRLTLQLDPRYEVLAYAMALDLLRDRYSQSDGMHWQTIHQAGALHWWPQGFRDTGELDFQVLLDEMVGLGVLRSPSVGRYVLRNPNVLLLLGTEEEIVTVLNREREPAVEFESATFRPPLRQAPTKPARNVFTYQQLSRLLLRENHVTVVAGTQAAGIADVVPSLTDYLGSDTAPVALMACSDRQSFGNALQSALSERPKDQVSVFVIPETTPWTELWLQEATSRLKTLRSENKFASLVFVAEPATLWRLLCDGQGAEGGGSPWMSLLQWNDGFLRHWLEERQLQLESEERRGLVDATGLWPALITELAGDCTDLRTLRERLETGGRWLASSEAERTEFQEKFGWDVKEPTAVIDVLAQLTEPVEASELAAVAEISPDKVHASLRWGELLGLTRREGAGFWTVDRVAARILLGADR